MSGSKLRYGLISGVPTHAAALRIVVVGSGVVGTATGEGLAARGAEVTFSDVSLDRIQVLRRRGLRAIDAAQLTRQHFDAYLLSVPTPTVDGEVDISQLLSAATAVGNALRDHPGTPLVVVRSTVPPGTTSQRVIPRLEEVSGRSAGPDFAVCVNPEFIRAAFAETDFAWPRVIVIGALDDESDRALRRLYWPWRHVPTVSTDLATAEAAKYVSNLFNAAKISFFNEMHTALERIGADPVAAFTAASLSAEGMWNARYGTHGKAPFGGACLPKDTVAFLGVAAANGFAEQMPILRATIAANEALRADGVVEADFTGAATGAQDEPMLRATEL